MLLWVTAIQIKTNREDNEKRDNETLRIQNLPLLKYDIKAEDEELNIKNSLPTKYTKNNVVNLKAYPLNITIKNIGANAIRNMKVYMESDFVDESVCLLGEKTQVPIEKNDIENIVRWIDLPQEENNYNIKLKVCYEDILTKWYEQEVVIEYKVTKYHSGCNTYIDIDYIVREEVLVDKM